MHVQSSNCPLIHECHYQCLQFQISNKPTTNILDTLTFCLCGCLSGLHCSALLRVFHRAPLVVTVVPTFWTFPAFATFPSIANIQVVSAHFDVYQRVSTFPMGCVSPSFSFFCFTCVFHVYLRFSHSSSFSYISHYSYIPTTSSFPNIFHYLSVCSTIPTCFNILQHPSPFLTQFNVFIGF